MAVSVRKPVLYAFGVVLCAGIIGGIWLWYRTHCVLITNDSRIEGTLVSVASRLSDRVVQVMVNEGDTVHKGQGLVRIDSRSVMARKAKAEAALELAKARWEDAKAGFRRQEIMAAQAHLDQAQAMLERAGRDFRRMEQLARNDGGVTQADRDAASSAYRAAQANVAAAQEELALKKEGSRPEVIRAAEAQVMQAQAELDEINVLCQDSVIPSPVNGVVAQKLVSAGELVAAGRSCSRSSIPTTSGSTPASRRPASGRSAWGRTWPSPSTAIRAAPSPGASMRSTRRRAPCFP